MNPLGKDHLRRLYWWGILLYFLLFSCGAISTTTLAALIGTKWQLLTDQDKFQIFLCIFQNWAGIVCLFLLKTLGRMGSGKAPIETGDTDHLRRE